MRIPVNGEPWQDYLALPIAPLVLVVQIAALFMRDRRRRWFLAVACPLAIGAMFIYVWSLPVEPGDGVNLGAGVLLLWTMVSLIVLVVAAIREVAGAIHRRRVERRGEWAA